MFQCLIHSMKLQKSSKNMSILYKYHCFDYLQRGLINNLELY